ncbi:hypothetical protein L873DRAFT_1845726 [Choiromyces venosus 120613-1]|uniref:Uncharacterized protein n=1 Tax=Choiromyces venosus 120613-1 TaxID=1336337 RepID=A0A3N4JPW0_9PEZI|nr:hypothetical protein L873DRAFT_1845726 [Choiromyces venosus 120613-1]
MSTPVKALSKVFAFLKENGKQLRRWVKRNESALITALVPTSIIVADARSGRKDAKEDLKEDLKHLEKKLAKTNSTVEDMGERLTLVDKRLTHVDKRLTHVDKKLTLVDNKQNFSQAFALRSTIKMMKLLDGGGNETDKEEIKKFIRDGEELMGCMERGGEGCDVPVLLYRICADNFLKTAQAVISLTPETDEKTYSIPANLGPSLHNTIHVFLSQQKHNVSPMAKKIIPQLLGCVWSPSAFQNAKIRKYKLHPATVVIPSSRPGMDHLVASHQAVGGSDAPRSGLIAGSGGGYLVKRIKGKDSKTLQRGI